MRTYIALLPGLIALFYLAFQKIKGARLPLAKTFLWVYVPTMLLLPHNYVAEIRFLHFNFNQFALLPVFFCYFFISEKSFLKTKSGFCFLDGLIMAYISTCVLTEYINTGEGVSGQSYWGSVFYRNILNGFIPYYLTRKLIYPKGLVAAFGKTIIICCLISLLISVYEWRMVINPHVAWVGSFFPDQNEQPWFPSYRYDWVRISGPYGHPILFGMALGLAFLYNHWLLKNKFWKNTWIFPASSIFKGFIIGAILFLGLLLTISRGPIYSTFLSFFILGLGYTTRRRLRLFIISIFFLFAALFALQMTYMHRETDRDVASSELESNVIYRANLFEVYSDYIEERFWTGWGDTTWPKATSMVSIDNEYIFILLTHGVFAFVFLCAILLITALRLLGVGMKIPRALRLNQSLAFMLLSVLASLSLAYLTTSMSGQMEILTFMILGLSQGFLEAFPKKQEYIEINHG